ncbi:aminopeptidase N [Arthrobacter sp. zg-Y820]|uniref:aminopeptidase N n=1 Tax=unclassified Arthrobacter TaxID=235627 RepID=UPI0025400D93|nr:MULTISPECIES: aminopeptidase N [unclassified Arthrobacter]MCC9196653.1 aminopeptidase N [Arthrobacter sp. zg-Y820]MDK1279515.1 aminopeptidase N [Arthrobacter sp. zg.Y820]MDK1358866.1 aminopeptidase N [Arthrobacter sp. zg-Y1219]WIB08108.1 aminopeptidase N [Arthrobacter sp. zg-Y820]
MSNQNLRREEAAARSALISVATYDVDLDLSTAEDPDAPGFRSRSTITFRCAEPGAATFLDFIHGGVSSVVLNGRELPLEGTVDGSRIHLADLAPENTVTVDGTALYSRSGEGMHRFTDPADSRTYLYTQYEPADARRVFANFEQPDLKAAFTFAVTAPSDWAVASNGAEVSCTPLAEGQYSRREFAPTRRISTYITSVLAGPYFKAEDSWSGTLEDGSVLDVPLGAYCRASMAGSFDPQNIFDITKRGLDYFHGLFAYPYPFGKYDSAFVPEYNLGAMENPGLVTFTDAYVFRSKATEAQYEARANTILHEMAHMWFGDLVTMAWWDDLWLKESFADYMGALAVDQATDFTNSWVSFANRRKAWAYVQDQLPTTHPIVADITDLEAAKQNFDGITYAKGASVLKQLVAYVGFDAFIAAARNYFRDHAYGNTTLADLLDALSTASGRDMAAWSRLWLQTAGVPTLTPRVETDDDGAYTSVTIVQDAPDPVSGEQVPRPHRLRIGLYNPDNTGDLAAGSTLVRTGSLEIDVVGPRTDVPELVGTQRPALLLLNDEDLTYAKIRFDNDSLQTLLHFLGLIPDPLTRAVCFSALWNSVRDGALSARDYVRLIVQAAPAETGAGVLQVILDNARFAVDRYAPAEHRSTLRENLYSLVVEQLHAADPGSDRQLVWARSAAALGRRSAAHAELLRGLLDGTVKVPGLAVDSDLRWLLWVALAATGNARRAELDAELARDSTASGRVGFTTATAAFPEPAAKAAAWQDAVHSDELSNQLLSATIEGFTIGSTELLGVFAADYFASLALVWSSRSIELASRIVTGLFPGAQDLPEHMVPADHPVLVASMDWLEANPQAPAALRRIIVEQQDQLLRALRAQAAGR